MSELIPEWVPGPERPRLAGRTAIVSGAGSSGPGIGNGRAAAILMAREGAAVAALDYDLDSARETVAMIEQIGGRAQAIQVDVTDPASCADAVNAAAESFGHIHVLVNNVGVNGPQGTAEFVELEEWDRGLRLNLTSMMLMAKHSVPRIREAGGGAIVNTASLSGLLGGYPHLLYPTSKGAIVQMTRAMAAQHGPDGIRVNCVAPGKVFTPMMEAAGVDAEMREHRRLQSVLKTEGTAWDVASAAVFLASDAARWITGVILPVDAGASAVQQAGASWPGAKQPAKTTTNGVETR
jgi:NAD(P)-dependent dehydrogenase (short-subunit alcohol dehydrogenase family)